MYTKNAYIQINYLSRVDHPVRLRLPLLLRLGHADQRQQPSHDLSGGSTDVPHIQCGKRYVTHTHTYTYTHILIHTHTHTYTHILIHTHTHTHTHTHKALGAYDSIKFWAGFNFPAFLYLCRYEEDNNLGIPGWITDQYSSKYLSIRGILMADTGNYFGCFYKEIKGTEKNKDGGIESGVESFRSNTLEGVDLNTNGQQVPT
jgi:hypothetical protein